MANGQRPVLPSWRRIDGATGEALNSVKIALSSIIEKDHLFGRDVQVTFPAASTSVKVATGLPGNVTGYRIHKATTDVRVWDGSPPSGVTTDPGTYWLQASAATTVTIYFY
jgi:hypothetical protein